MSHSNVGAILYGPFRLVQTANAEPGRRADRRAFGSVIYRGLVTYHRYREQVLGAFGRGMSVALKQ
jgi:hypothetical protein